MTASADPAVAGRVSLVEAYLARSGMLTAPSGDHRRYDEMTGINGGLLPGWSDLAAELDTIGEQGLNRLAGRVERLLEDDGVTYTPVTDVSADPDAAPAPPERWQLDPLPLVVEDAEWTALEAGLIQRSQLLDEVLTDIYGPGRLVANGLLPPELVFQHPDYLRPAHGITIPGAHQLFFHAVDVCRTGSGAFHAIGDRTQAPSGAGYAMADRRVVSRVLPDVFRRSAPRGLAAYFHTMRSALASVAPNEAEDPRIVVLTPGTHSETAFDQAMLASLLGVPLVESADLTIRRGRLWMRSMGRFEPVDVVVRRVDAAWSDPLDLNPASRLGVVGLTEACRRGTVTVVNTLGSGVLENPGLAPFLPKLARAVLGESLKLASLPTYWCGTDADRSHVLSHLDQMVLRPVGRGKSVFPALLTRAERDRWRDRLTAEPTRWVGQQAAPFSEAPMATPNGLVAGQVSMRLFTVAHGSGYVAMPGSLGRVQDTEPMGVRGRSSVAKDVWVRSGRPDAADRVDGRVWLYEGPLVQPERPEAASSPRVLEDMFWLGRYAERTEDLTRLLIVARERVDEFRFRPEHPGAGCVPVLLSAVTEVSGTGAARPGAEPLPHIRDLMVDATEEGTVAQSLSGLREAARSVRDQLSGDTWMVLGATDRALAALADAPGDGGGLTLSSTQTAVLSSMLALSGLASENMVRDPGWYFMDLGRRLERGQQLTALLRATLTRSHSSAVDSLVVESVLAAGESGVTYRRRYRGRIQIATMLELLLLDAGNPRSLAYQVAQARADLRALPDSSGTSRPQRRLEDLEGRLRRVRPADLVDADAEGRLPDLLELLDSTNEALRGIAEAVAAQHFWHPAPMQPLGVAGEGIL
ncbi:circularly permuted type 2 ATP-grasp protein [Nakamurella sp. GG22]